MKSILILIVIFYNLIGLTGCEKLTKTIWVSYNENKCSHPWGTKNADDNETMENVKKYFKSLQIKVFEVEILNDSLPDPCDACHCKSGKVIKIKIKEDDLQKAKELGFY